MSTKFAFYDREFVPMSWMPGTRRTLGIEQGSSFTKTRSKHRPPGPEAPAAVSVLGQMTGGNEPSLMTSDGR